MSSPSHNVSDEHSEKSNREPKSDCPVSEFTILGINGNEIVIPVKDCVDIENTKMPMSAFLPNSYHVLESIKDGKVDGNRLKRALSNKIRVPFLLLELINEDIEESESDMKNSGSLFTAGKRNQPDDENGKNGADTGSHKEKSPALKKVKIDPLLQTVSDNKAEDVKNTVNDKDKSNDCAKRDRRIIEDDQIVEPGTSLRYCVNMSKKIQGVPERPLMRPDTTTHVTLRNMCTRLENAILPTNLSMKDVIAVIVYRLTAKELKKEYKEGFDFFGNSNPMLSVDKVNQLGEKIWRLLACMILDYVTTEDDDHHYYENSIKYVGHISFFVSAIVKYKMTDEDLIRARYSKTSNPEIKNLFSSPRSLWEYVMVVGDKMLLIEIFSRVGNRITMPCFTSKSDIYIRAPYGSKPKNQVAKLIWLGEPDLAITIFNRTEGRVLDDGDVQEVFLLSWLTKGLHASLVESIQPEVFARPLTWYLPQVRLEDKSIEKVSIPNGDLQKLRYHTVYTPQERIEKLCQMLARANERLEKHGLRGAVCAKQNSSLAPVVSFLTNLLLKSGLTSNTEKSRILREILEDQVGTNYELDIYGDGGDAARSAERCELGALPWHKNVDKMKKVRTSLNKKDDRDATLRYFLSQWTDACLKLDSEKQKFWKDAISVLFDSKQELMDLYLSAFKSEVVVVFSEIRNFETETSESFICLSSDEEVVEADENGESEEEDEDSSDYLG